MAKPGGESMTPISLTLVSILLWALCPRSHAENLTSQIPLQTLYDEADQARLFGTGVLSHPLDAPLTTGTCPEAVCSL
jgi:hypothetical protein